MKDCGLFLPKGWSNTGMALAVPNLLLTYLIFKLNKKSGGHSSMRRVAAQEADVYLVWFTNIHGAFAFLLGRWAAQTLMLA